MNSLPTDQARDIGAPGLFETPADEFASAINLVKPLPSHYFL
jgi:hypothetical protein